MRLSLYGLGQAAAETGFNAEPLEKVARLLDLLERIQSHPFLKGRLVLKGGTALNLFYLDVPRLSVDIDLNYIGGVDRETMLDERPKVEQAIAAVCGGSSRRDWRTVNVEDIDLAESDVSRQLVPVLKSELAPEAGQIAPWTREMVATCRRLCGGLLPFEPPEVEFLEALNGRGEIVPELLTSNEELQSKLRTQPGLLWKAHNVRQHNRMT